MVAVPKNRWRTAEEPYMSLIGSVYGSGAKEPVKNQWRTAEEPYMNLTGSVYGSGAKEPVKNRWRTTEAPIFGVIQHQKLFPLRAKESLLVLYSTIFLDWFLKYILRCILYIAYPNMYVIYSNDFDNIIPRDTLSKEVKLENPISPIWKLII